MPKFKLIVGKHQEAGRRYVPGNIIDAKTDLAARFNTNGNDKYEPVPDSTPASPGVPVMTAEQVAVKQNIGAAPSDKAPDNPPVADKFPSSAPKRDLDHMNAKQLQELADAEEIDVSGLKTPADLRTKLKKEMGY